MYESYNHLKFGRPSAGVLELTLDHPPTNAISKGIHEELATVFRDIERDPETRVVVLTGAGERAFSAGGDIGDMVEYLDDAPGFLRAMEEGRKIIYSLLDMTRPVIARINGHAMGLGATLALFCDLSYSVEDAKIGDPHVKVGFAAGDGGALIWPQLIGYARAREYLLTGEPLTGKQAAEIGLITRAVPRDQLDALVYGRASELAQGPWQAISLTKQAINATLRRQFDGLIELNGAKEVASNFSDDHREAVMALREKRAPKFTGN